MYYKHKYYTALHLYMYNSLNHTGSTKRINLDMLVFCSTANPADANSVSLLDVKLDAILSTHDIAVISINYELDVIVTN